jgi:phosphoribosylformimino-5-aminoimidazole carboxamide ribotide isomerase
MLIPSIDLMGGKVVQLIQGKKKALEFENFAEWVLKFSSFPLVQLIDLDAAMDRAPNSELIRFFVNQLPCQVGGGIRTIEAARAALEFGAKRVIIGSPLVQNGAINVPLAQALAKEFGPDKLVFAIDARGGRIAIRGWKEVTALTPLEVAKALDQYCGAFLYTHIDTEGLMQGLPLEPVRELRAASSKQLIAAGGITTREEIETLHRMGVDAVVGMALYLGRIQLPDSIPVSK